MDNEIKPQQQFKVYRYRYLILVLYSFGAIINNVSNYIYIPIQTTIKKVYGLNLAVVSLYTNYISNVTYLPGMFIANKFAEKYGMRVSVIFGTFMTILSWWISCGLNWNLVFLPIGQATFGFGFPFFNMPQKVSADWYAPNERDLATSVFNIFYQLAASIGALIPGFFVAQKDKGDVAKDDIIHMLFFTTCTFTAIAIPIALLFKAKPPTPPSISSEAIEDDISISDLLKQRNYLILLIGTSTTVAGYLAIVGSIQPLVEPYGVSETAVSYMVTSGVISACLGSFIVGVYMSKKKKYKTAYLVSSFGATAILIVMYIMVSTTGSAWLAGILFTAYQFMLSASLPLSWEFLIEIAFPAGEAAAGSLMMTIAQFASSIVGVGISLILNSLTVEAADLSFYILIGFQLAGGVIVMFVSEDLRRLKYEQSSLLMKKKKKDPLHHGMVQTHGIGGADFIPLFKSDIIFDSDSFLDLDPEDIPKDLTDS